MKRLIILIVLLLSIYRSYPQSCLPEGIVFNTQEEIDSFQVNYPGCTEIEGTVTISQTWWTILNLNGLNVLTSIGGNLTIYKTQLSDLSGLESLTTIGGSLVIGSTYHPYGNHNLLSLHGLESLTTVGGDLMIIDNDLLGSTSALTSLTSIGGGISIYENNSLGACEEQIFCTYLSSPSGLVDIYNNAAGCNNPVEISENCGISLPCLPYGNYYFFSQADIDNYQENYTGCTVLEGTVSITGNDITNLNGLDQVTSIGGTLKIGCYGWGEGVGNPLLPDLSGFENLAQINGAVWITYGNPLLTSLTGLENLTSIGGDLLIGITFTGTTSPQRTVALRNIEALSNLTSIGGELFIELTALESLSGLDSVSANSITNLTIDNNPHLTSCEIKSICDYLAAPGGTIEIHDNASGCNSFDEVVTACMVGFENPSVQSSMFNVQSYPNPLSNFTTIEFELRQSTYVNLSIYNPLGQKVEVLMDGRQGEGKHQLVWDANEIPSGIYYYRLTFLQVSPSGHAYLSRFTATGKLVKY